VLLLERWVKPKPASPSLLEILGKRSIDELLAGLAQLAYRVQRDFGEQSTDTPEISEGLLYDYLRPLGDRAAAVGELIDYLRDNPGVLVSPGQNQERDVLHFAHRSFQEYLAAEHLVNEAIKADHNYSQVREQFISKPQLWRGPSVLIGDILTTAKRNSDLWRLLGYLLEADLPTQATDSRWWCAWLAATLAEEQKLYEQQLQRRLEQPVREALITWLVALLNTAQALPPIERAACGRLLSLLGDPRPGVGLYTHKFKFKGSEIVLPKFEWCDIPVLPRRIIKLGYSFKMSKYPVTYEQYQTFVDSGDYDNPLWWQRFLEEYQAQTLHEQYFKYKNHPRKNVSWYEAVAFTHWLNAAYAEVGLQIVEAGLVVRLPLEQEWEYAAMGASELKYPYGNEFDETRANTRETGVGMTTAVGSFPDGASPFGVQDMCGNVWEWCLNRYSKNSEHKVVRGGSFANFRNLADCTGRAYGRPLDYDDFMGFRLVVAPAVELP
jgi:hypothetical protein